MSASTPTPFVRTRWWWVRHPVRSDGGRIYGGSDIACDCGDATSSPASPRCCPAARSGSRAISAAPARPPRPCGRPATSRWTAPCPASPPCRRSPSRISGRLAGPGPDALLRRAPARGRELLVRPRRRAPAGRRELCGAVRAGERRHRRADRRASRPRHRGGGPWRHDPGGDRARAESRPQGGLAFAIENCSLTRLDHYAGPDGTGWRVGMVNAQPWLGGVEGAGPAA